jgi:4-hydroxy-tetrahydrodipicolinate synthase
MDIDSAAAIKHARSCLQNGCSSVTLFGTTGEGSSIANSERSALLGAFLDAGIAPEQIVVGVMANSYTDAALQSHEALDIGCRSILLAPPSYFKHLSDDGLFDWFSSVFNRIGKSARSVILYNIPSVTAVEISVDLVTRLREAFPEVIAGVKDSSGDWPFTQSLLARHNDLTILIGDERGLAAGVRRGGQGAISGLANVCPHRLLPMAMEGREDADVTEAVNQISAFPVIPAIKALIAHRTGMEGWRRARAPLRTLSDSDYSRLIATMDRLFEPVAA